MHQLFYQTFKFVLFELANKILQTQNVILLQGICEVVVWAKGVPGKIRTPEPHSTCIIIILNSTCHMYMYLACNYYYNYYSILLFIIMLLLASSLTQVIQARKEYSSDTLT